jgi:hypothetical protein
MHAVQLGGEIFLLKRRSSRRLSLFAGQVMPRFQQTPVTRWEKRSRRHLTRVAHGSNDRGDS